ATSDEADAASLPTAALTPAPILPLEPIADAMVEVSTSQLQEALDPHFADETSERLFDSHPKKAKRLPPRLRTGSFSMQQALLRVMIDALMARLYQMHDHLAALSLQAQCTLLAQMQRWHRASRQRVVNAVPVWSDERQRVIWQLTVGVPMAAYAAA
ncbi:MAG TPA: hypothetical protein VIY29_29445, partial [Ktedonobacteraceae bacterium]